MGASRVGLLFVGFRMYYRLRVQLVSEQIALGCFPNRADRALSPSDKARFRALVMRDRALGLNRNYRAIGVRVNTRPCCAANLTSPRRSASLISSSL